MAFGRVVQLDIGLNNNLGIRISNLHFSFEVERSVEKEGNFARILVYNAKKETRDKVLIKDNNIFLKAGYKDENNLGLLFSGIIQQSTSRLEGVEYITEIYATDWGGQTQNYKSLLVNLNFNAGIPFNLVVQNLSTILNVPVIGLKNISSIILNNGFIFYGTVIQAIKHIQKKLKSYNIGLYFDLGEMVIYKLREGVTQFKIVNISPKSGLLGEVEEIIDEEDKNIKRISFTSLLNSKIRPNTIIKVSSLKVSGGFIIQKLIHRGGNITSEDFVTEVEAIA